MSRRTDSLDGLLRQARSAFRLETLPEYLSPGEAGRVEAWRAGAPRPVRSVRTSGYLEMVARAALAGQPWVRVRLVHDPLTEYERYQLRGYLESQAAGEEIRIGQADLQPGLVSAGDFWLIDAGTRRERVAVLRYSDEGAFLGFDLDRKTGKYAAVWDRAVSESVPLNQWLAEREAIAA